MLTNQRPLKHLHKNGDNNNYPKNAVYDTLTNGFFTVDNKWTVKFWNEAAEKILKVKAVDIVGKNLWQKFEGIIPSELRSIDQRAIIKDKPVHFYKYWHEMNAWFDVITYHNDNHLSISFKSSKHPHTGFPASPVNRLKVLTELYRFVTEITNDCLWEWNLLTTEIFWIDGGHKRIFGYEVENALVPQSFWEACIHPQDREATLASLTKSITKKSLSHWEATYRFKAADDSYLFVHDRAHIVRDSKGKATRIIGSTQNINEKTMLEKKLAEEQLSRQKQITDAVLKAQENEREYIANVLNENLNQLLVATKWNIQRAKIDTDRRDDCLENSSAYLNDVIGEIRKIYKTLAIPDMRITGLFENVKDLLEDTNKAHQVKFTFTDAGIDEEEDLGKQLQLDIFRMVQELVNNVIEHSHAVKAKISITRRGNYLMLIATDNGIGTNHVEDKTGVGIINILSRAELYGGKILVTSKPGKGYKFTVTLPCFTVID